MQEVEHVDVEYSYLGKLYYCCDYVNDLIFPAFLGYPWRPRRWTDRERRR